MESVFLISPYLTFFLILLLDNFGLPIPEEIILIFAGYSVSMGIMNFFPVLLISIFSILLGDNIGYWIARLGRKKIIDKYSEKIPKAKLILEKAEKYYNKFGNFFVFISRFVYGLRSASPYIAGVHKMSWPKFMFYTFLSALVYAPLSISLGFLFGESARLIEKSLVSYIFYILIISLFLYILFTIVKKKFPGFFERKFSLTYVGLLFLMIFSAISGNILLEGKITRLDLAISNSIPEYVSPGLLSVAKFFSFLADIWVILGLIFGFGIWFFLKKEYNKIFELPLKFGLAAIIVQILKYSIRRYRPENAFVPTLQNLSFPSSHSTIAVFIYGTLLLWSLKKVKNTEIKVFLVFAFTSLIFAISVSRIILNVHYLSDVIGGICLGLFMLILSMVHFKDPLNFFKIKKGGNWD